MIRRAKGCRQPVIPPHRVMAPFRLHPAMRAGAPAPSATPPDFRAMGLCAPHRKDQGQTGSCSPHRTSTSITQRALALGTPLSWIPSEADMYRGDREVARARVTPSGTMGDLQDNGSATEDVVAFLATFGIRPRRVQVTSDGRNSDVEASTVDDDTSLLDLEQDASTIVVLPPQHAIDPGASDVTDQILASLNAKIPVWLDFFCDQAFESWSPDQPAVGVPDLSDPNGGGHAVNICGARINPTTGLLEWLIENSWGDDIAEAGFWWVSTAFIKQAWGLVPADVRFLFLARAA